MSSRRCRPESTKLKGNVDTASREDGSRSKTVDTLCNVADYRYENPGSEQCSGQMSSVHVLAVRPAGVVSCSSLGSLVWR